MTDKLRQAAEMALKALEDMNCGWKYIRESHGDLYGVGWDRAQEKADDAIKALRQALEQPVSFYVYEWVNPSDGIVFRSFRHDEHHMGREPDRTIAFTEPDTGIDRGAWSDVPDATKWVDALRGDEESEQEPEAWTLTEFLDKRETTTNAPLWFVDPVNSAWTPLYTAPPSKPDVNQEMLDALTQWANAEASNDQIELENARTSRDAALAKHKEQA